MSSLVISGHRELTASDITIIDKSIREFIEYQEFEELIFGGARGADTAALEVALKYRGENPGLCPRLIVVVPNKVSHQSIVAKPSILRADKVIELGRHITKDDRFAALHHRNHFMIDWAAPDGRLLAFWNGNQKTGTASTIRYAKSQMVEVSTRTIVGEIA